MFGRLVLGDVPPSATYTVKDAWMTLFLVLQNRYSVRFDLFHFDVVSLFRFSPFVRHSNLPTVPDFTTPLSADSPSRMEFASCLSSYEC